MAKRLQFKRLVGLALFVGLAFVGLGFRLVQLQVVRHDELTEKSQEYTGHEVLREPRRGDILDIRGNPLATSLAVKTVCADPSLIGTNQAAVARAIAPILGLNEAELTARLAPTRRNDKGLMVTNKFVVLKRKVQMETWQKVQVAMTNLTFGVDETKLSTADKRFLRNLRNQAINTGLVNDQLRVYPNQSLAAHVLGFVGTEDREINGFPIPETSGKEGVEFQFNSKLAGARGWLTTEKDRYHREVVAGRDQDVQPRDGLNVVLTIDAYLQHILEAALVEGVEKNSPKSISGLIVRPRTGEILAMATLPTFNPNNPGTNAAARRNRIIGDMMEPGSTFKIVPVSGALNDQTVRLGDTYDCENGRFPFAGRVLHDSHPNGVLSVEGIIMKSSNIGAAKIGIKMGPDRLDDYIRKFGFGARSGIPLPGEASGMLNRDQWTKVSVAQVPMGQGIAVTRLQVTMAICAIANGGKLMQPMLVNRLQDRDGKVIVQYTPQQVRQVVSETAAKQMITALKTVVSPEGTAPKAALDHYTVAGKTGTAQKAGRTGYIPDKYISSFIGFFPADNPELCIAIVLDEPAKGYYGGQTAAPIFKQVAESAASYLSIRPDRDPESAMQTGAVSGFADGRAIKSAAVRTTSTP